MKFSFNAPLWQYEGEGDGAWYFVTIPIEYAQDIKELSGPRRGFGSVRVEVSLGESTWKTSVFPDSKSNSYLLPIKKSVRQSEGLSEGHEASITLSVLQ